MREKFSKILLIDDDAIDRELFIEAIGLIEGDYTIWEAENGKDAIALLQESAILPQLIILDLNMPVMDGRDTLKELKKNPLTRSIPVCIMSTSCAHFDIKHAYAEGAALFLVKPMQYNDLTAMLTSLFNLMSGYVCFAPSKS